MSAILEGQDRLIDSIKNTIQEQKVELLHMQFVDIEGTLKHVTITTDQLEEAVSGKIMFDGSSILGFSPINKSDLYLMPDLNTFTVLPWSVGDDHAEARFLCSVLNPDGTPFEGDSRNVLKTTIDKALEKGYAINIGPELEFFLFDTDENGKPTTVHDDADYFAPLPHDDGEEVRLAIYRTLKKMGFTIEASHHEVAKGQHEISFKYDNALGAADRAITYKWVVKTIAKQFGLHASFMPKPVFGENGSGMHVNISLFDNGKSENAFYDEKDGLQLTKTAYHFIAGLLSNVKSFVAVTNPLVNSYKRLVPGYEAPCYLAWSASNRSALIRIPATRGAGTRVEIRCPDPSANPYLAYAMVAASGLDGIEKEMGTPAEIIDDIFSMSEEERKSRGIENLPGSLGEALEELKNGYIGKQVLGDHVYNEYVKLKQDEWDEYRTNVHQWEIDRYQRKF